MSTRQNVGAHSDIKGRSEARIPAKSKSLCGKRRGREIASGKDCEEGDAWINMLEYAQPARAIRVVSTRLPTIFGVFLLATVSAESEKRP